VIGDVVKGRRLARRLTQVKLGKLTGLSQDYISKLERGEIDLPQRGTLDALAGALDLDVADFYRAAGVLTGVGEVPPPKPEAESPRATTTTTRSGATSRAIPTRTFATGWHARGRGGRPTATAA
jgi:transcriptional regulator with XRE-family HTH domain